MFNPKVTIILFCFFLVFCSQKKEVELSSTIKISPVPKSFEIEDSFDEFKIIHLKNIDLIANLYRAKYYNESIYILDGSRSKLYKIGKEGKLNLILSFKGDGPYEYNLISDFQVLNENEEILIYDGSKKTMMKFAPRNNLISSQKLEGVEEKSLGAFQVMKDGEILFNLISGSPNRFFIYNLSDNSFYENTLLDSIYHGFDFGSDKGLTIGSNNFSTIYPFEYKILSFNEKLENQNSIALNFGVNSIAEEELKGIKNDPNQLFDLINNDMNPKVHSFILEETENFYLVQYFLGSFVGGKFLKTIISKDSKKSNTFDSIRLSKIDIPCTLIGKLNDDRFIFSLNIEYIKNLTEEQKASISEYIPADYLDDNPILLIGKVKAF
ncbi:6-bladed beta-propeller [Aquiflexum sp. LQ15W]|uniref:6-bladed beta-propeller n=1 Tax=Cognataquiflexum nitidum TaxID=2922272 RepID=UPI001F143B5E|nr:6-bladed beta-propeller [Cognataquiflexum nitidum]MCH6201494.1 6-bladed beta-propeller [Cognataquiflexum nitidum]